MIDTVFISDLHLHPKDVEIKARFDAFISWVETEKVKKLYILGDFFHAWAGDDSINDWSKAIAEQLNKLVKQGVELFYMHGNRDFLLGKQFAKLAGWTILSEPTVLHLGNEKVLLVHGDRYCIKDKSHQWFRLLTRNSLFYRFFMYLPLSLRVQVVDRVRQISKQGYKKTIEQMDVVEESVIRHLQQHCLSVLIHGHTHKPGLTSHFKDGAELKRYVLSDWDDTPMLLCYNDPKGIFFIHCGFDEVEHGK